MKKLKIISKLNNHSKRSLLTVILVSGLSFGLILKVVGWQQSDIKVIAHPTNEITIDADDPINKFTIPKDVVQKAYEPGLDINYKEYLQGKGKTVSLGVQHIIPYQGEQPVGLSQEAIRLPNGNRIIGLQTRNDGAYHAGLQGLIFKVGIGIVNEQDKVIKTKDVLTGESFSLDASATIGGRLDFLYGVIDEGSGRYSVVVAGKEPAPSPNSSVYKVFFDQNLAILGTEKLGIEGIGPESFTEPGKFYQGLWTGIGAGDLNKTFPFDIWEINMQTMGREKKGTLEIPSWNSLTDQEFKVGAGIGVTSVSRLANGNWLANIYAGSSNSAVKIARRYFIIYNASGQIVERITYPFNADHLSAQINAQGNAVSTPENFLFQKTDWVDGELVLQFYRIINGSVIQKASNVKYPSKTNLTLTRSPDSVNDIEYSFHGNALETSHEFLGFIEKSGAIIGSMNSNFELRSVNHLSDSVGYISKFENIGNGLIDIRGASSVYEFATEAPSNGWTSQLNENKNYSFFGKILQTDDYAPLISVPEGNLEVSLADEAIKAPVPWEENYTSLDRWLLTGEKNGTLTSPKAVKVFDLYDIKKNTILAPTEAQRADLLLKKINRNPNSNSNDIDWKALGFDKENSGPQQVTYFITDSQKQITATSRWVNKVTESTQTDPSGVLSYDAQNFGVTFSEVNSGSISTNNQIKKLMKSKAWNNKGTHEIYEDHEIASFDDSVVSFTNAAQLTAVRNATSADKAKPYPLDIKVTGKNDTAGKEITNTRIWVFVTKDNTTINKETGIVLYADDFKYPLHESATATADKLLKSAWDSVLNKTEPKVKAYDFVAQPTNVAELTPLSNGKSDGDSQGLNINPIDLVKIQGKVSPEVLNDIKFTYQKANGEETSVPIKLELYHEQTELTVKFVDGENNPLKLDLTNTVVPEIVYGTENVGTAYDLTEDEAVLPQLYKEKTAYYDKNGYTLATPLPVTKAGTYPYDKTGKRTLTFVFGGGITVSKPANITFKEGVVSPLKQELARDDVNNDWSINVFDRRPTTNSNKGKWKLTVELTKNFQKDTDVLSNILVYEKGDGTKPPVGIGSSNAVLVHDESAGIGGGKAVKMPAANKGLKLDVAGSKARKGTYQGEVKWTLIDGP